MASAASLSRREPQTAWLQIMGAYMITSIVLINVERSNINETAEKIAGISGISEVYSVTGNYDLVAIARVKTNEELSDLITNNLVKIDSVKETNTMMAFRAYSKHDLDAMFSI